MMPAKTKPVKSDKPGDRKGYGFGTFQGVFTPSILTIIGVVMYLRFGWMLGNVGLTASLVIVTLGSAITFLTGLSISALATNMRMKGGGAYFMLSRSFGVEAGAAMGLPLALAQAIGVSFYVAGFSEALVNSDLPLVGSWNPRLVGFVTLGALALVSTISADIALKSQYFIMGAIAFSLFSFFMGGAGPSDVSPAPSQVPASLGFWPVFAVFFPAVTGILSGVGMSGDLKNPSRSIPLGDFDGLRHLHDDPHSPFRLCERRRCSKNGFHDFRQMREMGFSDSSRSVGGDSLKRGRQFSLRAARFSGARPRQDSSSRIRPRLGKDGRSALRLRLLFRNRRPRSLVRRHKRHRADSDDVQSVHVCALESFRRARDRDEQSVMASDVQSEGRLFLRRICALLRGDVYDKSRMDVHRPRVRGSYFLGGQAPRHESALGRYAHRSLGFARARCHA